MTSLPSRKNPFGRLLPKLDRVAFVDGRFRSCHFLTVLKGLRRVCSGLSKDFSEIAVDSRHASCFQWRELGIPTNDENHPSRTTNGSFRRSDMTALDWCASFSLQRGSHVSLDRLLPTSSAERAVSCGRLNQRRNHHTSRFGSVSGQGYHSRAVPARSRVAANDRANFVEYRRDLTKDWDSGRSRAPRRELNGID